MENIFLGLVPAIAWGIQPLFLSKIGGKATNQQMGLALGTFVFSLGIFIFKRPGVWTSNLIIGGFLCGLVWAFAQFNQIRVFSMVGVSRVMPISTAFQLIGNALVGVIYFGEWDNKNKIILGIAAIACIIVGIVGSSFSENQEVGGKEQMKKGIIILFFSALAFVGYSAIPRVAGINGWDALLPQTIGMVIGSFIFCSLEKDNDLFKKKTLSNLPVGFIFGIANLTIMLSNEYNGVVVGFTLSQLNVIVATLGGLFILKEKKTTKELKYILGGLILVAAGGILIGLTKG